MQKEIFQRLNRIDHLIRIKGTGTPSELAEKIGMSERSMYEYIRLMKEFGAPGPEKATTISKTEVSPSASFPNRPCAWPIYFSFETRYDSGFFYRPVARRKNRSGATY